RFFPTLSMMLDILPETPGPLILDVRQNGAGPPTWSPTPMGAPQITTLRRARLRGDPRPYMRHGSPRGGRGDPPHWRTRLTAGRRLGLDVRQPIGGMSQPQSGTPGCGGSREPLRPGPVSEWDRSEARFRCPPGGAPWAPGHRGCIRAFAASGRAAAGPRRSPAARPPTTQRLGHPQPRASATHNPAARPPTTPRLGHPQPRASATHNPGRRLGHAAARLPLRYKGL
ncbi:hypothetical protein CLV67_12988, partial [Actinoplanes italicus]